VAEAESAMPDCKLSFWDECYTVLKKAIADDPSIQTDPRYQQAYGDAVHQYLDGKAPDSVEEANRKRLKRPHPKPPVPLGST